MAILFFFGFGSAECLLRRVRGTARAGIGIPDEPDSIDLLAPRALKPRVLVRLVVLCHSVCECVESVCLCAAADQTNWR